MTARIALAESIAAEFGIDMSPEMLMAADKVLMRLWLFGFVIGVK